MSRDRRGHKTGGEQLIGGFTLVAVFGLLAFSSHQWLWLIPACCAGVPAILRGMNRIRAQRAFERQRRVEIPRAAEVEQTKQILRVAQSNNGKVTPAIVTLNSSVSLEEAERILQELSSKGYATMTVTDSGHIEYEFPEFSDQAKDIEL